LQSDFAQRPAGLGAAGEGARFAERRNEFLRYVEARRDLQQAPQTFTGGQHQIVARPSHEPLDPCFDRRGIRRVLDAEHRALQHIGALLGEQASELCFLACLENQDAIAVQPLNHLFSLPSSRRYHRQAVTY